MINYEYKKRMIHISLQSVLVGLIISRIMIIFVYFSRIV